MTTRQKQDFVEVIEPFTGSVDGETFVIKAKEVFSADHRIVRAYPDHFRPLDRSDKPEVEQMTKAPGEKRGG